MTARKGAVACSTLAEINGTAIVLQLEREIHAQLVLTNTTAQWQLACTCLDQDKLMQA